MLILYEQCSTVYEIIYFVMVQVDNDNNRRFLSGTNKIIKIPRVLIFSPYFYSPIQHDNLLFTFHTVIIRCSQFWLANGDDILFELCTLSRHLGNSCFIFSLFLMSASLRLIRNISFKHSYDISYLY